MVCGRLLEEQGYQPLKDLLAYWAEVDFKLPRLMSTLIEKFSRASTVEDTTHATNLAKRWKCCVIYSTTPGRRTGALFLLPRPSLPSLATVCVCLCRMSCIQIAEVDGVPAAFMVGLPNLNEIFAELNGNLFPFGWVRLIRHLNPEEEFVPAGYP